MPRKPNPAAAIKAPQSVGPSGCRERLWNGRDGFTSTVESCPANNAHAKQNEGSFPVTGTPAENCFRPPERVAMAAAAPAGFPDRPHRRRRRNRGRPGRSCLATPCPHFFSRRGAGAQRRNHLNPTTPPITAARDLGWGCACHPLLRASAPPCEKSKQHVIPDTNFTKEPEIVQAEYLRFDSSANSASSAREASRPSGWAQPQPPRPGMRGGATGRWRSGFGAGLERFGLARPRPGD